MAPAQHMVMLQLSMLGPAEEPTAMPHRLGLYIMISNAIAERLTSLGAEQKLIHEATEAVVERLVAHQKRQYTHREFLVRLAGGKPICWICSFPIALDATHDAPDSFSIDHVIPKSKGGKGLGRANLKPAHRFCNIHRSDGLIKKRKPAKYEAFLASLRTAFAP
jgi:5-methylcytosine-specific restriction endonuclease McrA